MEIQNVLKEYFDKTSRSFRKNEYKNALLHDWIEKLYSLDESDKA